MYCIQCSKFLTIGQCIEKIWDFRYNRLLLQGMKKDVIKIKGVRVHNLKNVSVDVPRNKLVVITGISGSGKSSLAFDTLYAEGQRRYVESLSIYARQFLGIMDKPDVEKIEGISPAISIDQRKAGHNPRSTVGTITEIYDYFRLLFSKVGQPHCPECGKPVSQQTVDQIVKQVLKLFNKSEITILAPTSCSLEQIKRKGFVRVRIDRNIYLIDKAPKENHNIEIVVDQLVIDKNIDRLRLKDSLEIGLKMGKASVIVNDLVFSANFTCEKCNIFIPELEPRFFSFNNPYGACPKCKGLGEKLEIDPELIIPNSNLTIAEGAIMSYRSWNQFSKLAEKYNFSLDEPVKNLSKKILSTILYGDNNFVGAIPNLERKYHETNSDWTHQEIEQYMVKRQCPECLGKRLKPEALAVIVNNKSIDEIVEMPISETKLFFEKEFPKIAHSMVKEILIRLQFLIDVGLDYLTLDRKAITLAGGEGQRIRLATQIGSKLTGVLYILDEPSVGLHPRDQAKLIKILKKLRDLGNTVIVVEHDNKIIRAADWVIDVGPGAGKQGGRIMFEGTPEQLMKSNTLTGKYLSGKLEVSTALENSKSRPRTQSYLTIKGAEEHNLKNIDVRIPFNKFVCITGVSGSGKSSLMNDILAKALLKKFYHAKQKPGKHKKILGAEFLNKVVLVDQSPIGRTPRSNPATYTGAFLYIRELFSKTKEAGIRDYSSGRFSFNIKGGRCESCEGQGQIKVEMYFLPDVYIECKKCKGKRYNKEALEIEYNGKNIAEVLEMTVKESLGFFRNIPGLFQKLKTLNQVGLSYIQLGQPAPSLSGGEAQRIKLATELSRKSFGKTLYILDEPTTGLHPDDIKKLVLVLKRLVEKGNTVLVIEHNLDIMHSTDWIIDLGPEGGDKGGYIVAQGRPKDIAKNKAGYTGRYLKRT